MDRVKGKVAVVTGGAMGIGKSSCLLLAREGAKVAVTDMNPAGEKVAAQIRRAGGVAEFWKLNTTKEKDVAATFKTIAKKFGNITVLVNNAGILGTGNPPEKVTEAEWDKVMDTNVKGVFFCTKHAVPYMRKARGWSGRSMRSITRRNIQKFSWNPPTLSCTSGRKTATPHASRSPFHSMKAAAGGG